MRKKNEEEKVLDVNASMQGTLTFSDPVNLRINGKFQGKLNTKGTLTIGEKADVSAEIVGEEVIISGKVKGNIIAERRISILSSAFVEGDISTPSLEIKQGAIFEGNIRMVGEKMGIKDLSRYLDIEEDKIQEWLSEDKIPASRDGDSWVFEKKTIDRWITNTGN